MPTYFPELPKLPNPAAPVQKLTEVVQQMRRQFSEFDAARAALREAGREFKHALDETLKQRR